jgi:DNA-binding MarR family transcriptional regulator
MADDGVDSILEQWRHERPDVDLSGMAIIGRISRLERMIQPLLDTVFAAHHLESWEFDLLATLRRAGPPHQLSAGHLLQSMMISSGTVTNRIDRLQAREFVQRSSDPGDGRRVLVTLTKTGLAVIDAAVTDHTANEAGIVARLEPADRAALETALRNLHHAITTATATGSE